MKCEDCKYSKTKSQVARDGTIMMDRFCYHDVPFVQLIPQAGGVGQITYRPKVEDDDFCSKFSAKRNTEAIDDIFGDRQAKAAHSSEPKSTDSDGGSGILLV